MLFQRQARNPDFTSLTAQETAQALRRLSGRRKRNAIKLLLYDRTARPVELEEQRKLLLTLSLEKSLATEDRLNALVAATHKSIEVEDNDTIRALLTRLDTALEVAADLPTRKGVRESRTHVGTSICYVSLLGSLFSGASDFEDRTAAVQSFLETINTEDLYDHFFRTVANFTRCHALITCRKLRRGDREGAAAHLQTIERGLIAAVRAQSAHADRSVARRRAREKRMWRGPIRDMSLRAKDREYLQAHSVRIALQRALRGNADSEKEVLRLCVSDAVPGLADRLATGFDDMWRVRQTRDTQVGHAGLRNLTD